MNTYSVETVKTTKHISLSGGTDLKETVHEIYIPWNVNKNDLTQVMEFVDRLRKDYPNQHWTIYEHIKQVIDY